LVLEQLSNLKLAILDSTYNKKINEMFSNPLEGTGTSSIKIRDSTSRIISKRTIPKQCYVIRDYRT